MQYKLPIEGSGYSAFRFILSLAAALITFGVGVYLAWTADAVNTQFGMALVLFYITPRVLQEEV